MTPTSNVSAASPRTNAASAPRCSLRNVSVTVAGGSAASNQEAMLLRFRNRGRTACSLDGYPKIIAVRPGNSSTAADRLNIYNGGWTGSQPPVVELEPGQSASAVVGGGAIAREGGGNRACYHQRYKSVQVSIAASRGVVTLSALLPKEGMYLPSCAGVAVTPFAPGVGWFLPSTPTTLPPQAGYRGFENFCAVAPLTGTILYDGTSGRLTHVLTLTVSGLPPDDEVNVNWSNDHVRAPVIASFKTDSGGTAIQSSLDVARLGEVRGVEIVLTASSVPNPVLGRLEPC
ncbi:MAG TPA: DUF4232 domain-containing protein [Acidimicrobiales bacterium]|nr:DUF4232 domain-containing protein [Acidimicrobiales bacterium]